MKTFAWILAIATLALGAGLLRMNSGPSAVTPALVEQVRQTQAQTQTQTQAQIQPERRIVEKGEIRAGGTAPIGGAQPAPEPFHFPVYRGTLFTEKVVPAEE